MSDPKNKKKIFNRRNFLPLLGAGVLMPAIGFGNTPITETQADDEFETLIKADGTPVKVSKRIVQQAPVKKEKLSNIDLLKWLKNKYF